MRFDEAFAQAFSKTFDPSTAAKMAFDKWKTEKELPQTMADRASKQLSMIKTRVDLGDITPEQARAEMAKLGIGQQPIVAPSQNMIPTGQVPPPPPPVTLAPNSVPTPNEWRAKDLNAFGVPTGYERNPLVDKAADKQLTIEGKTQEELGKKYGEAGRIAQAMRGIIGYGKAMDETKMPNWQREILSKNDWLVPFLNDEAQNKMIPLMNYISQLTETKVGALPILSGQARYVVDLANAIAKTQATPGMGEGLRKNLAAQSLRNIMALVYGIENGYVNSDSLAKAGIDEKTTVKIGKDNKLPSSAEKLLKSVKLTEEQEKNIEGAIDYLLSTPALYEGKFSKKGKQDNAKKLRDLGFDPDKYELVGE